MNFSINYFPPQKRVMVTVLTMLGFIGMMVATVNALAKSADEVEIVKKNGNVLFSAFSKKNLGKANKQTPSPPVSQPAKNVVSTGSDGRAVVKVGNNGYIVLEKNSTVEINPATEGVKWLLRQVSGVVYYMMNSRAKNTGNLEIKIKSATIGIRGTRFLISDSEGRNEIGVQKGLINVASPEGDFEIHRKAEEDEFAAFKRQGAEAVAKEKKEFDEFKAKTEREFVEFKKEFTLGANKMVSIEGKRVEEKELSEASKKDIATLENYALEWANKIQD